jgi:PIN domain nuclease of toxin-antitoxin system
VISHLLDTHILAWWLLDVKRLNKAQTHILEDHEKKSLPVGLSAVSLRELAVMIQRGRIEVGASLDAWLDGIESHPLLTVVPLTGQIAAESVRLGDDFPRDPADQIIVATARHHSLTLLTADEKIRKWGKLDIV